MAGYLALIASAGDREAFAMIFEHYGPRVKAYHLRAGANPAAAEELTQDAMAMVWRRAGYFDPAKASPSTWIFAIARNLRIDAFRRDRHALNEIHEIDLAPPAAPMADDDMARAQEAAIARRCLAELPDEQQTVLRMAYYEDKSQSEIAAALRVPLGTVKSRMRLALSRLRAALAGEL